MLELTDKNPYLRMDRVSRNKPFTVPLVPASGVDAREHVRLSLDLLARPRYRRWGPSSIHKATLVLDSEGQMSFVKLVREGVARYDVLGWDQKEIFCQFRDRRDFFVDLFDFPDSHFLMDGKLYLYNRNTLMVLDVQADRGIRKLGHLQRFSQDFRIRDIVVEEDGNILLLSGQLQQYGDKSGQYTAKSTLYLLRAP